MNTPIPTFRLLTLEEARAAVAEGLAEFDKPENKARMEAAIAEGTRARGPFVLTVGGFLDRPLPLACAPCGRDYTRIVFLVTCSYGHWEPWGPGARCPSSDPACVSRSPVQPPATPRSS